MSLLSVVKDVCAAVGVAIPGSVFASLNANRTMQEMVSLANEMAQRIAYDTRDWRTLKVVQTVLGDGATTIYSLPANYKRMLLTTNLWSSANTQMPLTFIADTDEWMQRRASGYVTAPGEWMLLGDNLHIYPALAAGVTATYGYLDKNCIKLISTGYGDHFMQDDDLFRLDERLLKLGMIWQWKALKGSPYAEDMGTYSDAIATAMGKDKPSPIIVGRMPISSSARVVGPWPAGWGVP